MVSDQTFPNQTISETATVAQQLLHFWKIVFLFPFLVSCAFVNTSLLIGHYKVYYKELEDKIAFEVDFASLIELLGFDHPDFPETMQHQLEEMVKGKINRLWRKMRNMGALLPVYLPNGALGRGQYTWAEFTQRWAAENWDGRMV